MSDASAMALVVTLLARDADARRLVASWPNVPMDIESAQLAETWGETADVSETKTRRVGVMLLRNGICREDRTVHPEAVRVVHHIAAETLRDLPGTRRRS